MNCPECGHPANDVIDSRKNPGNVWRRRQCRVCKVIWVTEERMNFSDPAIIGMIQDLGAASQMINVVYQTLQSMRRRGGGEREKPGQHGEGFQVLGSRKNPKLTPET